MKLAVTSLLCACCLLPALSTSSESAASPYAAIGVFDAKGLPAACTAARTSSSLGGPIANACFLQVECADSSVISCNGASTCQTTPDGLCVQCDGVPGECCDDQTCCDACIDNVTNCLNNCDFHCYHCNAGYNYCVSNCTGGC